MSIADNIKTVRTGSYPQWRNARRSRSGVRQTCGCYQDHRSFETYRRGRERGSDDPRREPCAGGEGRRSRSSAASRRWHLIGHLQTNKARYAVKLFDLIHSVDSLELASGDRQAGRKDRKGAERSGRGEHRGRGEQGRHGGERCPRPCEGDRETRQYLHSRPDDHSAVLGEAGRFKALFLRSAGTG